MKTTLHTIIIAILTVTIGSSIAGERNNGAKDSQTIHFETEQILHEMFNDSQMANYSFTDELVGSPTYIVEARVKYTHVSSGSVSIVWTELLRTPSESFANWYIDQMRAGNYVSVRAILGEAPSYDREFLRFRLRIEKFKQISGAALVR